MKINDKFINLKNILENGDILSVLEKDSKEVCNAVYIENLNLILYDGGGCDELKYYDERLENEFFIVTKIKRIRLEKDEFSDVTSIHKDTIMSLSEIEIEGRIESYVL